MKTYSVIYKAIQNSIKDLIITKLLDKIIHLDKEIAQFKEENTKLKSNLVLILKNTIQEKTNLVSAKKKINVSLNNNNNSSSRVKRANFSLTKINSQYLDTDINEKESRIDNYINRKNNKNKSMLALSPKDLKNTNDNDLNKCNDKSKEIDFIKTESSTFKHTLLRKSQLLNRSPGGDFPLHHISQVVYYKTNAFSKANTNLYTPNKSNGNDSMISVNGSMIGSVNCRGKKKDKRHNLIKIQKKIMSQNQSFSHKI